MDCLTPGALLSLRSVENFLVLLNLLTVISCLGCSLKNYGDLASLKRLKSKLMLSLDSQEAGHVTSGVHTLNGPLHSVLLEAVLPDLLILRPLLRMSSCLPDGLDRATIVASPATGSDLKIHRM